jgi:MoxR domain in the MoxR-vWA-beta-propeller ternary systems
MGAVDPPRASDGNHGRSNLIAALEQDRFARVITGKLPEAEFAFVDEVFKANSAILNSLLAVINERVFHNDGAPVACPLVTMFGASNELPEGRDLEALFDRFLLRCELAYLLRPANLRVVLTSPDPTAAPVMTMGDLRKAQLEAAKVAVTDETIDALVHIRTPAGPRASSRAEDTWANLMLGLRLGEHPRCMVKTTPRPLPLLRKLMKASSTLVRRGSRPTTIRTRSEGAAGTRLGQQELCPVQRGYGNASHNSCSDGGSPGKEARGCN